MLNYANFANAILLDIFFYTVNQLNENPRIEIRNFNKMVHNRYRTLNRTVNQIILSEFIFAALWYYTD